jgi:pimeloyl-ACP methyl ester carboxylesterase
MPRARVSDTIELEYDITGDPGAPPLVLVMGFAMQMTFWDPRFVAKIADQGFRVVRFDNRDVGLSTKLAHLGTPDFMRVTMGDRTAALYAIEDMAGDLVSLLDALQLPSAHLVGASMGGFIAQETAIGHPERVKSLTSIMSTTGNRRAARATSQAQAMLLMPTPTDRAGMLDHAVRVWKTLGSPGFPFDEARIRARAGAAWDRNHDAAGVMRQAAAVFTQRDRTTDLAKLFVPTLVIHGADDPLISVSGGEATANAVPGARLLIIPGMGHDLPEGAWDTMVHAIVDNARRAVA